MINLKKVRKRVAQRATGEGKVTSRVGRPPKPGLTKWNIKIRKTVKKRAFQYINEANTIHKDSSSLIDELLDNFLTTKGY